MDLWEQGREKAMHSVQGSSMALPNVASLQSCDLWMVTSPVRSLSKALITKTLHFHRVPTGSSRECLCWFEGKEDRGKWVSPLETGRDPSAERFYQGWLRSQFGGMSVMPLGVGTPWFTAWKLQEGKLASRIPAGIFCSGPLLLFRVLCTLPSQIKTLPSSDDSNRATGQAWPATARACDSGWPMRHFRPFVGMSPVKGQQSCSAQSWRERGALFSVWYHVC